MLSSYLYIEDSKKHKLSSIRDFHAWAKMYINKFKQKSENLSDLYNFNGL